MVALRLDTTPWTETVADRLEAAANQLEAATLHASRCRAAWVPHLSDAGVALRRLAETARQRPSAPALPALVLRLALIRRVVQASTPRSPTCIDREVVAHLEAAGDVLADLLDMTDHALPMSAFFSEDAADRIDVAADLVAEIAVLAKDSRSDQVEGLRATSSALRRLADDCRAAALSPTLFTARIAGLRAVLLEAWNHALCGVHDDVATLALVNEELDALVAEAETFEGLEPGAYAA
jgi:hypothetical protein